MPSRRSAIKTLALASAAALARPSLAAAPVSPTPEPEPVLHDPLRPGFHYLPSHNWMNDPCGPLFFQGQYHLFHQYNPQGALWGDMHWAHAVSPDMVHWKRLPIALAPTPGGPDAQGCFTGTAAIQDGRPTFLYTGIQDSPRTDATILDEHTSLRESQCLAVAADDTLLTWKKLPAAVIPLPPPGMKVTGFRDPSPWKDGDTWYAIVGSGIAGKGGMVLLYRSPDLRAWEYLHPLYEGTWTGVPGPNPVDTGEMWECPDFFPLTDLATKAAKHVLIHSAEGKVLWQSGTLDKAAMRFTPEKTGELDYGRVGTNRVTYYAPKTQLDAQGNRILWGWIAETRPDADCVRAGWSGLMSLPRVLTLRDGELHMQPARQTLSLRAAHAPDKLVHEFHATIEKAASPQTPFHLEDVTGPLLTLTSDPAQDPRTLHIVFGNGIPPIVIPMPAPLPAQAGVSAYFDNSVLELFIDNRFCLTHRYYSRTPDKYSRTPDKPIATVTFAGSVQVKAPQSYTLDRIWPA